MPRSARQAEPSSAEARVALARSLIAAGNFSRAEAELGELLKAAPNAAVVHAVNGTLHASRNNPAAARTSFERALELSPGFLEALGGLTYLDLQAKNPARAIARLDAEIVKQPTSAPLFALLARAHSAAGDEAKAEQALRRAVSVDPRFTPGYTMLAQLYVRQRRIDEARTEFEGIVQRDPSAVGARTMVGMLLEAQGKRDEARKSYEATVNGPGNAAGRGEQPRVHLRRAGHESRRGSPTRDVGQAAASRRSQRGRHDRVDLLQEGPAIPGRQAASKTV